MGIDISAFRLLSMVSRHPGVHFSSVAMIGRQQMHLRPSDFPGIAPNSFSWKRGDYAEDLFRAFGANDVQSFDFSAYEGATIVHDFNVPVPDKFRDRFSLVFDGGTIEHIIDPRQAIENEAAILAPGGHLVVLTICNGDAAHGFYQLSPEFFYSLINPENGFSHTQVFLIDRELGRWHLIASPKELGTRNYIPNRRFYIACVARKSSSVSKLAAQQSDYETIWKGGQLAKDKKSRRSWRDLLKGKRYSKFLAQAPIIIPEQFKLFS